MTKIVIFISGKGSNMEAIIKSVETGLLKDEVKIVAVLSNNPTAEGLEIAKKHRIDTFVVSSSDKKRAEVDLEFIEILNNLSFDYIVLAGYMKILSGAFIQKYPNKIINIHPADTLLHQGLHAYQWAFDNKMEKTKITIHYVNEGVDTGKIIAQETVDLIGATTLEEVERRGLAVEHRLYAQTLKKLFSIK